MNIAILTGNISRDIEVRYTQDGKAVATFNMATNEKRGEEQYADFHKIVAFSPLSENLGTFKKGDPIVVTGKIRTRSYEAKDGSKRYVTEIVANNIGLSAWDNKASASNFDNFSDTSEEVPF